MARTYFCVIFCEAIMRWQRREVEKKRRQSTLYSNKFLNSFGDEQALIRLEALYAQ